MSLLDRLDVLMKERNEKPTDLARGASIPVTTIYGLYQKGYENAKLSTLIKICDYYGVTLDYLVKGADGISDEAQLMAAKFDALDAHGQRIVSCVLDLEYDRLRTARPTESTGNASRKSTIQMRVYDNPAAAGAPLYAESDYELLEYSVDDIPTGADYGVRICGKSMEPEIPDGCTAWVRKTERICDGDIVIAWVDGDGTVCKRAVCDGDRIKRLKSINRAYDDIAGQSLENLRIYGKVLGYTAE